MHGLPLCLFPAFPKQEGEEVQMRREAKSPCGDASWLKRAGTEEALAPPPRKPDCCPLALALRGQSGTQTRQ